MLTCYQFLSVIVQAGTCLLKHLLTLAGPKINLHISNLHFTKKKKKKKKKGIYPETSAELFSVFSLLPSPSRSVAAEGGEHAAWGFEEGRPRREAATWKRARKARKSSGKEMVQGWADSWRGADIVLEVEVEFWVYPALCLFLPRVDFRKQLHSEPPGAPSKQFL